MSKGFVNWHNCVYWCKSNHHLTSTKAINSPGAIASGTIHNNGLIVNFFFNENVSGDTYLKMMSEYFQDEFQKSQKALNLYKMVPLTLCVNK